MAWQNRRTKTWVLNHQEADYVDQREVLDEIQYELDQVDRLVGHNLKFDLQWLRSVGLEVERQKYYCTQVAEYLIRGQSRRESYRLADVSRRYGIIPKIDRVKKYWQAGYETDEIPLRILNPYLEQDCINALIIFQRQVPIINELGMQRIIALQMELMNMLAEMEQAGAMIDVPRAQKLYEELMAKVAVLERDLKEAFGREDLRLSSNDELSAALYGGTIKREQEVPYVTTRNTTLRESYVFHYKDPKKAPVVKWKNRTVRELVTKKRKVTELIELPRLFVPIKGSELDKEGYYSTDKNTLKQLKGKSKHQKQILVMLKSLSENRKAVETFKGRAEGSGILGKVMPDSLVHPSFNQTIAATGRLTSSNPNGQNLPRKGTSPIKKVFIPRFDLIGNGDLSQLEWRVAAFMSQDPVAMQEIIDDVDYHRDNAIKFFGADSNLDNDHPDFKPIRTTAKVFGFRLLYGGSAYGMYMDQNMPNFPRKRWEEIVSGYYEKYQRLEQWQSENIRQVHDNQGWLQNPSGRILTFSRFDRPNFKGLMYSDTAIKNYPVQSFATADITPLAMTVIRRKMRRLALKSVIMLQVHDSIVFDLVEDEVDTVADITVRTFEALPQLIESFWGVPFNVPLTGEFEVGPNYGELHTIRKGVKVISE